MRISQVKILLLSLAVFAATACQRTWQPHPKLQQTRLAISGNLAADDQAEKTIAPYREKVMAAMSEVIGTAPVQLEKMPVESPLGNFVADLQRIQAQKLTGKPVELGLINNGGLRSVVPQGNIKTGDIFELMPFENELLVLTVNGAAVQQLFNFAAKKKSVTISGATYGIKGDLPQDIRIDSVVFDPNKTYRLAVSDFLANGGDDMTFLKNPVALEKPGITLREVIIKHIRELTAQGLPVEAKVEGRVQVLP